MEYIDRRTVSDEVFTEELDAMFGSYGWRLFCSELFANSEIINDLQDVTSMEDLFFKKGQLATLGYILNYPTSTDLQELGDDDEGT